MKYLVVMNLWPIQTDFLFETDSLPEAKKKAQRFNDQNIEIWANYDEVSGSYEKIEY